MDLENGDINMKYIASWSGGKDSTATIILAHERNEPLDTIIFCEVMFDKKTTGELPEKIDFVRNVAKPIFESWGYKVEILHYEQTFIDGFNHVRGHKSKWAGKRVGFPMSGRCYMNDAKRVPIKRFYKELKEPYTDYVGIAVDEEKRLSDMKKRNTSKNQNQISLLEKYGYTEAMAFELCKKYSLLSPVYEFSKRDGCWFCPNAREKELKHLKDNHPELWQRLKELEESAGDCAGKIFDTREGRSIKTLEEKFYWQDAQINIFDFI